MFCCASSNYSKVSTNRLISIFQNANLDNKDTLAVTQATLDEVDKLLDLNADPNATFTNERGNKVPIISFAAQTSNPKLTKLLLDYGANPNTRDHKGRSCLGLCLSSNSVTFTTKDDANPEFGKHLLEMAKKNLFKREETIKILLDGGAKTKILNRTKETPMQNILIGDVKGSIIKNKCMKDTTRIHDNKKEMFPQPDMNEYSLSVFDKKEAVTLDKEEGVRIIKRLIAYETDLNLKEKNGYTPLHIATLKQDTSMVNLFVDNGADVNAKSKKGVTPLHISAYKLNKKLTDTLVENGANPQLKDRDRRTPSDIAILKDNLDFAKYIGLSPINKPSMEDRATELLSKTSSSLKDLSGANLSKEMVLVP